MYNNKLAIAVKSNGKVLREQKDQVFVPFGTEYTLLIKNLDSVRAQVRVNIDGIDATEGISLVIPANGELELERFVKSGNMTKGNRFKFIERTGSVEEHRGIGVTDGLIRIEYQFEKRVPVQPAVQHIHHHHRYDYWDSYWNRPRYFSEPLFGDITCSTYSSAESSDTKAFSNVLRSSAMTKNATASGASEGLSGKLMNSVNLNSASLSSGQNAAIPAKNENGITVEGSVSEQQFSSVFNFAVESETHVMVVKLLGETAAGAPVIKAVTVKQKVKCKTCGRTNKAHAKFCTNCGTSLEIV